MSVTKFGVISAPGADHRVHVLRHHAEQVGAADLSARLHEEPPGLPSRPPRASVALLQLHVHARWVRLQYLTPVGPRVCCRTKPLSFVAPPQVGAAGVQCFVAADDWGSFGDGPWHLTNKSALHGRSAGR